MLLLNNCINCILIAHFRRILDIYWTLPLAFTWRFWRLVGDWEMKSRTARRGQRGHKGDIKGTKGNDGQ